ncbi:SpoIIE family protein phosphatase [Actinomycetospora sp. C-140]
MPDRDDALRRTVGDADEVREAFEELPLMMAAMDGPELRFVAANAAYRALARPSQIIGRSLREIFPEMGGQQVFEAVERVYDSGEPSSMHEWRMQFGTDDAGEPRELFLDVHLVPRFLADGSVRGVAGYITDVTELVRARQTAQTEAAEVERRYERARDVIAVLQRELLSPGLPVLPSVRIAASYLLADADTAAGGDWFDALPLSQGRVGLVVGDVVGHGVAASAVMGQLRAIVAERLHSGATVPDALAAVDSVADRVPGARAATVCIAELDTSTGAVSYCTAGHPPPLVVPVSGEPWFLPPSGAGPLGTGSGFPLAHATLDVGDVVLCYTDGIIERPGRARTSSSEEFIRVAADTAAGRAWSVDEFSSVGRMCAQIPELLVRATGHSDDITLLAAQVREPLPALDVTLPGEQASIGTLRRRLSDWLAELEPGPDDLFRLLHGVNELVTNAVEHAPTGKYRGSVRLRASVDADGRLHASVSDEGRWSERTDPTNGAAPALTPAREGRGRGLALSHRLLDSLEFTRGVLGTTARITHRLARPARLLTAGDVLGAVATHPPTRHRAEFLMVVEDRPARVPRLRLAGPVDSDTAEHLRRELVRRTADARDPLIVDLSEVTLLASAGVAVLAAADGRGTSGGLELYAPAGSEADQVLTLVGIDHTTRDPGPERTTGRGGVADLPD